MMGWLSSNSYPNLNAGATSREKKQNKTKQFCWQVSLGLIAAHVFSFWSLNYLSFEIIFNFKFYFGNEVTYRSHVLISTKKVTCK